MSTGFVAECETEFGTSNLYEILALDKDSKKSISAAQIKKAYYSISLKWHPDRVTDSDQKTKENATKKFQLLSKAYSILSDKEQRAVYDETGVIDDENVLSDDRDWNDYWRLLFKKVTTKDIEQFSDKYRGSSDERADLKAAYLKFEGDMEKIMEHILCCTHEDEERFKGIIEQMIGDGEVTPLEAFMKEPDTKKKERKRKATKEAKEAEAMLREMSATSGTSDLEKMIQMRQGDRQKQMDGFFDQLEAKYAQKPSKKGRKK